MESPQQVSSGNPYQPPQAVIASTGPSRWPYLGWLAPLFTWMPAMFLLGLFAPMFSEMFDALRERGELPALTSSVMAIAASSRALFHLPIALFLMGLIAGDISLTDWARRRRTAWLHKLWQTAICVVGITAAVTILFALLLPMIGTSRTI